MVTKIVGAHFRPPAKGILAALPLAHPLIFKPEPSNPYDANAIQVLIDTTTLEGELLNDVEREILPYGSELSDLEELHHLGYIPKEIAATLRLREATSGELAFTLGGMWAVKFEAAED